MNITNPAVGEDVHAKYTRLMNEFTNAYYNADRSGAVSLLDYIQTALLDYESDVDGIDPEEGQE